MIDSAKIMSVMGSLTVFYQKHRVLVDAAYRTRVYTKREYLESLADMQRAYDASMKECREALAKIEAET